MEYEEWLAARPHAVVCWPEPIPGAVYEPLVSTNKNTGRSHQIGFKTSDPISGDCLERPWGHGGGEGRFVLRNLREKVYIASGNIRSRWYPHRQLSVSEITRISTPAERRDLSRAEFDGSRIARLIKAGHDQIRHQRQMTMPNFPSIDYVIVDTRPEYPQGDIGLDKV
jgi:hypothetical protein